MRHTHVIISIMLVLSLSSCASLTRPAAVVGSEDAAIARLGDDIRFHKVLLARKRIGVFYFATLDWRIVDAGKRLSAKLTSYLAARGDLTLVPWARLDALMKSHAIEQATIYDIDAVRRSGQPLPVDAIIYGTIVHDGGMVTIETRVIDVNTGRQILVSAVRMPASGEMSLNEKAELLQLYRKSPESVTAMNKAYFLLHWMKANQPLVYLLVTAGEKEMESFKTSNTVLYGKLKKRKNRYNQDRPDVIKKINTLKAGVSLMERHDQQRFDDVMKWKKELLARMR